MKKAQELKVSGYVPPVLRDVDLLVVARKSFMGTSTLDIDNDDFNEEESL